MSFFSRLFGQKPSSGPSPNIEAKLQRWEAEAENAAPGYVGTAFNKAGDLALKGGQPDRAVGYYGRAIDAFLEDAQREAARGVANKIIRVRPSAVRTLCTLTWLDLAAGHQATALLHLRDYVAAAKDAGQHARAATQIFAMAHIAPDAEFVEAVADGLDSLDFSKRGRQVRRWVADGSPGALSDSVAFSEACLGAAVRAEAPDAAMLRDVDDAADAAEDLEDADTPEDAATPEDEAPSGDPPAVDEGSSPSTAGAESKKKNRGKKKKKYRWD